MKKMIYSMILITFIFIAGCVSENKENKKQSEEVVEPGDIVEINYIAWEKDSGVVFETSIKDDANVTKETELDDSHKYRPMKITVKAANPAPGTIRTLPGLEDALIGMKVGEEKIVEIPPEKGYGYPDKNQIKKIKRNEEIPRYMKVRTVEKMDYQTLKGIVKGDIKVGNTVELVGWWDVDILSIENGKVEIRHHPIMDKVVQTNYGPYKVTEITEDVINLEFALKEGEKFNTGSFKAIVSKIEDEKVLIKLDYRVGEGVRNTLPECSECFTFGVVTEVTDEYITVDFNFPLKGKTVVFKVKIVSIEKPGS